MLLTAPGVALHGGDEPAATSAHRQPAWKLVVALDGLLVLRLPGRPAQAGAGFLVPPAVPHALEATGAHRCLLVEPWVAALPATLTPLSGRLAADLAQPTAADLPAVAAEICTRVADGREARARPQARVRAAAQRAGTSDSLGELARDVGLSPVRLRELVRAELGVPLSHLRLWQRMAAAAAAGREWSLADRAHAAGFADQPHLSRTVRRFTGRTPVAVLGSTVSAPDVGAHRA